MNENTLLVDVLRDIDSGGIYKQYPRTNTCVAGIEVPREQDECNRRADVIINA